MAGRLGGQALPLEGTQQAGGGEHTSRENFHLGSGQVRSGQIGTSGGSYVVRDEDDSLFAEDRRQQLEEPIASQRLEERQQAHL